MSKISSSSSPTQDLADQYRLQKAEKEELQADHEKDVENRKKSYEIEKAALTDRFESSLQNDQQKHYENLRNIKKQMNRSEEDLSHKKDEVLNHKKDEINQEYIATDSKGRKDIEEARRKYTAALDYENKRTQDAEMVTRTTHKKNAEAIMHDSETKIGDLYAQKKTELETTSARNEEAIHQMHESFERQKNVTDTTYKSQLKNLQSKTQTDLDARRKQNAVLMGAYAARQEDPFYQIVQPQSEITDTGDSYVVRVKVPEHEREKFKVQLAGQELQLSGTRSTDEKAEIHPGNWVSTSTYQNYTERFPLAAPVDPRTITMKEDGDYLEYTILKHGPELQKKKMALIQAKEKAADQVKSVDFPATLVQTANIPKRGSSSGTLS